MADNSKIEWTDATWNPVNGCSLASPGCTNCYAMKQAHRFPVRQGLTTKTKGGMVWTGEVRFNEKALLQPLKWKRPRRIFVCAHGDLFHDSVPDEWIDRVFAVMALCPQHTFQVLTKRSARMREWVTKAGGRDYLGISNAAANMPWYRPYLAKTFKQLYSKWWPLPNVWLGVSVEDQARANERIPDLLATPAAVRWLSCEPLLGPVDLRKLRPDGPNFVLDSLTGQGEHLLGMKGQTAKLDWIVTGGESGPGARPMHPDWARGLRDQCQAAGVPFLFKQWGEWFPYGGIDADGDQNSRTMGERPGDWFVWYGALEGFSVRIGKKQAGRYLDGALHTEFPA